MINRLFKQLKEGTFFTHLMESTIENWYSNSEKDVFHKQKKMLDWMLVYAVKNCPYYSEIMKGETIKIENFPIVDKHLITNNFNKFVSRKLKSYIYSERFTGGSTGEPFKLYATTTPAGLELKRWKYYGYQEGEILLAMDGTKLPEEIIKKRQFLYKKNNVNLPYGSYGLSSLYLTDNTAADYCNAINELKPDYIRGYPSFVYSIACYAQQLGIEIVASVKAIELTSESAFDYQIEKIREVFGKHGRALVYLQYGHTENSITAYTFDETYRYRVEPLLGYVEVLDSNDKQVHVGEVGEVVVTSLHNKAMPLIRYRTGDYAEYGGKDERYVYLNKVYGRTQDYIVGKNNEKVLLTALIFAQHFNALGHIFKWQLEQKEKGQVIVKIIKGANWSEKDEKEISELFERLGNVDTIFNYVDDILLTPRGKSKMLVQHLHL